MHLLPSENADYVNLGYDLDMKAVAERFTVEETVPKSLMAGADCFLACRDPQIQTRAEAALTAKANRCLPNSRGVTVEPDSLAS